MSFVLNDNIFGGGSGSGGGGKGKNVTLLSVTTAPSAPFEKGSKYYDSTTKKIYTAKEADTWTGAEEEEPQFYTIYIYDNNRTTEYYQWDGDDLVETDLEKYQLISNISQNYADTSTVHYPSSKALSDGIDSVKPQLYDTQIFTEPKDKDNEARKGWAAICNSTRQDLAKADVPTVYADILYKYENVEKEQTALQTIQDDYDRPAFEIGEYTYFTNMKQYDGSKHKIYKSANADLSDSIEVFDLSTKITTSGNDRTLIYKNGNYIIAIYGGDGSGEHTFFVFDLAFNYITHKTINTTIGISRLSWKFPFLDDDNYFYFANYTSSASGRVYHFYRWNLIDCVLNNQTFEELEVTAPGSIDSWIKINNILYASIKFSNNNKVNIYTIDFATLQMTLLYESTYNSTGERGLVNNNGTLLVYSSNHVIIYENGVFNEYATNLNWVNFYCYTFVEDTLYVSAGSYVYTSTDFKNFTQLVQVGANTGGTEFPYATLILTSNNFIAYIFTTLNYYEYVPTEHTQSFGDITITYYKYNDWKICVPDTDNDNALDDLYSVYGYCPFWRIDTANETITLQRNSNKFAMMYVGDDYEEDTFPTGDWERAALISEVQPEVITIDTASVTIANIQANKNYVLSNNALTDITFTACETSYQETTIEFTTGSSAPILTDSASIEWVDGSAPILSANSSYIILIWNKKGFVREY